MKFTYISCSHEFLSFDIFNIQWEHALQFHYHRNCFFANDKFIAEESVQTLSTHEQPELGAQ